jgi:hypothetical protein
VPARARAQPAQRSLSLQRVESRAAQVRALPVSSLLSNGMLGVHEQGILQCVSAR